MDDWWPGFVVQLIRVVAGYQGKAASSMSRQVSRSQMPCIVKSPLVASGVTAAFSGLWLLNPGGTPVWRMSAADRHIALDALGGLAPSAFMFTCLISFLACRARLRK